MIKDKVDAVVIGAGPCGLFQAFQLGLQGIKCHVLEASAQPGGQCHELYSDKPIYDIPGIPHILAGELSERLLQQIAPFNTTISLNATVTAIEKDSDGTFSIHTTLGSDIHCGFVVIATGAGAFTPVKMRVPGIEVFENDQLHYTAEPAWQSEHITVIGDTDAALACVGHYAAPGKPVNYIHRKKRITGDADTIARFNQMVDRGLVNPVQGKVTDLSIKDNRLHSLFVTGSDKRQQEVLSELVVARLGNSPKVQNYTDWGLSTERNLIVVTNDSFSSNVDGLYAVGDINSYTGKRKLILCGFHEATLVAFAIAAKMQPDKAVHTQYTTTSTELLKRLGVLN